MSSSDASVAFDALLRRCHPGTDAGITSAVQAFGRLSWADFVAGVLRAAMMSGQGSGRQGAVALWADSLRRASSSPGDREVVSQLAAVMEVPFVHLTLSQGRAVARWTSLWSAVLIHGVAARTLRRRLSSTVCMAEKACPVGVVTFWEGAVEHRAKSLGLGPCNPGRPKVPRPGERVLVWEAFAKSAEALSHVASTMRVAGAPLLRAASALDFAVDDQESTQVSGRPIFASYGPEAVTRVIDDASDSTAQVASWLWPLVASSGVRHPSGTTGWSVVFPGDASIQANQVISWRNDVQPSESRLSEDLSVLVAKVAEHFPEGLDGNLGSALAAVRHPDASFAWSAQESHEPPSWSPAQAAVAGALLDLVRDRLESLLCVGRHRAWDFSAVPTAPSHVQDPRLRELRRQLSALWADYGLRPFEAHVVQERVAPLSPDQGQELFQRAVVSAIWHMSTKSSIAGRKDFANSRGSPMPSVWKDVFHWSECSWFNVDQLSEPGPVPHGVLPARVRTRRGRQLRGARL